MKHTIIQHSVNIKFVRSFLFITTILLLGQRGMSYVRIWRKYLI